MSYKLEIVDFSGEIQSLSPPDLFAYFLRVINTWGLPASSLKKICCIPESSLTLRRGGGVPAILCKLQVSYFRGPCVMVQL